VKHTKLTLNCSKKIKIDFKISESIPTSGAEILTPIKLL